VKRRGILIRSRKKKKREGEGLIENDEGHQKEETKRRVRRGGGCGDHYSIGGAVAGE